ncbi:hypothetical protein SARC_09031 [Sphaeroforma arctica JP610]|uniref:Glycoside-hydrolase family GH114 TIM-barrel domain-containing protein n=1 Tax=Sphaeroforma arctica JP610 TaxID=667725 RepID=A0A0L0FP21_9EUKA|nr:hypothetical protein SARC_09031 [Sphaeroforma arctica JP610]KNC78547.1 hypothetical protein SARC_09031 [Sphaeroforma arctica JP610]|eukprot:XP_014152449.1 hypothetical protein SARC_09031 [Sphaeroforma arctica JP610]
MVDVDMFGTSENNIKTLVDAGHYVVCYIDLGTAEDWRPDYDQLVKYCPEDSAYSDERWLDITQWEFAPIMDDRLQEAKDKGYMGLEYDNIDCESYGANCVPGESISSLKPYEIAYLTYLADKAHDLGMSVGMKNAVDLITTIGDKFDWAINESCAAYNECGLYEPFKQANKAVFGVEYDDGSKDCSSEQKDGIVMKYEENEEWHNCSN